MTIGKWRNFGNLSPAEQAKVVASLPEKPVECDGCGEMITDDDTLVPWRDTAMGQVFLHLDCYAEARKTGNTKWLEDNTKNSETEGDEN